MRKFLFALNCLSMAVSAIKSAMGLFLMLRSRNQYLLPYKGR